MESTLTLVIVTPERMAVEAEVQEVIAPGADGYFGVLPGHCNFISTLKAGTIRYRQGPAGSGEFQSIKVQGGFADIRPDRVTILAETAD